jgi:hypothetical protein
MAIRDNIEGRQVNSSAQRSSDGYGDEKAVSHHQETLRAGTAHEAAERGHAATDKSVFTIPSFQIDLNSLHRLRYGRPLVQFDLAAEARLRWKIDLYIVPTVALLYLFCFIDRANIGQLMPALGKERSPV